MIVKKILYSFFVCVLCACSRHDGDSNKLTAGKWIVDDAILEVKDNFFAKDTLFRKNVEEGYEKREYLFNKEGGFSISQSGTTVNGQWNFAKDDTAVLFRDIGKKTGGLVMRNTEGFREIWMPWTNKQDIFTDYFGEDRIQVIVLPADEDGTLYLTLKKK